MLCWSCQKEIANGAKRCPHCEADVADAPTAEEMAGFEDLMATMSPELINGLRDTFEKSATGEEFVNQIMVGDCPTCGSSNTDDCEDDPDIDDISLGRCFDCGQVWCPDCGELFKKKQSIDHDCPAWEEFDFDDDEQGDP